jgi:hypothetical protein
MGFFIVLPLLGFFALTAVVLIAIWLCYVAFCIVFGITTLVPTVIVRKKSVPLIVFSIMDILSGFLVFGSFIFYIIGAFSEPEYSERTYEFFLALAEYDIPYELIIVVFLILMVAAIFLVVVGAVLSIIRAIKSRKDKIPPRSLDITTHICVGVSSVVLFIPSLIMVLPISLFF